MTLKELSSRLYSLAVFRGLLRDPVMEALARCVRDCADLSNWDALGVLWRICLPALPGRRGPGAAYPEGCGAG